MERYHERDCTSKCRSSVHAKLIQNCVITATPSQLRSYSIWLCRNFAFTTDEFGRNLLHVASSCGKYEIVEWLIKHCNVDVDAKDHESGWTSLHRSFFYGQLASARTLWINGASLYSIDHEGLTPLDVILKDRLPYIEYLSTDPSDVYVWGSNFNDNLGLGNSQSRSTPEILEVFRKDFVNIQQVQICKFHSVFLSTSGHLYTCGYGYGGRLGQETEDNSLIPSLVKGLGSQLCTQVAAGQDHMIILLENGQVWSCGLNVYHQLGHFLPSEKFLVPKPLSLKFLNGKKVIGVRAARFHSVIYTRDSVYTFGLNAGQLGHSKGEQFEILPRQVSGLYAEDCQITHLEVSDGATVCATNRGDVYVLHEYQIRKIASRQLNIKKISIVGGHLDSRVNVPGVREDGGLELRVALLAKSGKIYLWRQSDTYLRRCLFISQKEILVSDFHMNHYSIGLITFDNEGYLGHLMPSKGKRTAPPPSTSHTPSNFAKATSGLVVLLDIDDCHLIKVVKLPNIYRATSITSDSKGRNFAVLQSNPKMGLVEVPCLSNSRIASDYGRLLSETHIHDDFHDIVIKVDKREFAAHKYILASRCDYFKNRLNGELSKNGVITLENAKSEAFEQILKFIYTNSCDFLTDGYEVKWDMNTKNGKNKISKAKPSKASNPVVILHDLSKRLNMNYLAKRLDSVRLVDKRISVLEANPSSTLCFKRDFLSNLSDVNLISSDGILFRCHKCVLIARLDYFHSMLSTCWAENAQLGEIPLPISSKVLEAILDFLYSDNSSIVIGSDDVEFLCQTLMFADQLLIPLLKEICEISLVELLSLKNSGELLEISSVYNALQLKRSCMQFICINLAAIVELKVLEVLSEDIMEELSIYYRNLVPAMQKRKILSRNSPSQNDLIALEQQFPVSDTCSSERRKPNTHECKTKNRRRCNSLRSDSKDISTAKTNADSENSNKNIILDIVTPDDESEKLGDIICSSPKEKEVEYLKSPAMSKTDKRGHRIMKCPKREEILSLGEIMLEEERKLIILNKKSSFPDMKPIPHLSQKQKKRAKQQNEANVLSPSSPPSQISCPWAKLSEQSPPSPSFWESFSKKDFTPSPLNKVLSTPLKSPASDNKNQQTASPQNTQDIVISLHEIQKAEERKLLRTINPKIKPLHLINIEDQAIEELCMMYNVNENHKEKITVNRVRQEEIASPVWRRKH